MAKGRKSRRKFPATRAFQDRNITSLDDLKREGATVKGAFSGIPNIKPTSWLDDFVPDLLWAAILGAFLDRDKYLSLFRSVVHNAREKLEVKDGVFITHSALSSMSAEHFYTLLQTVLEDEEASAYLRALLLIDCLPDRHLWESHLEVPDDQVDWNILAHAVTECFDHQSQLSTDIRWFKLLFMIFAQEKLQAPPDFVEEIAHYPNQGDMKHVRPSIRAMEIAFRNVKDMQINREIAEAFPVAFWDECYKKWACILPTGVNPAEHGPEALTNELLHLFQELEGHFHETVATTSVDAKHDSAFGLALYGLTILFNCGHGFSHMRPEGRVFLRVIVEAFITLRFLAHKDNETLWRQYRSYGNGQTKLAFLKNLKEEELPDFVDLKALELLANEDMWLEFEDIDLGSWSKTNLRAMAEEAGCKDVYDRYYDWTSGFAHSQWGCVRDSVFEHCLNPLHRFHRVPALPKTHMPSVLKDGCKLLNRMLDDINTLYPSFKPRIKWHNLSES
ncbi:hypothetical protein TH8_20505 [Thalassospira profundimaris]|nr:hypothetical protein TH8_20505 [Thalassospira profundimaris]